MAGTPFIRAVVLHLAADFLERLGAPVERLLARAGLSPRALEDPEALVAFHALARFLEGAARSEGIEDLGLRLGAASEVQQLGTFGRLIEQAFTLHEGIETAHRNFSDFSSGERPRFSRERDEMQLYDRFVGGHDDWRQAVGLSLMLHLNYVRSAAGPGWRPAEVGVPTRSLPGYRTFPMLADTKLVFEESAMRITFSPDLLHLPLAHRARDVRPAPVGGAEREPASDVRETLHEVITILLSDGRPSIQLAADAMRISSRTLQRRLQGEGVTFARVLDRARFETALRLLEEPARKLIDVALELGYSDPAHFTRAFSRWTGVTPREFRRIQAASRQAAVATAPGSGGV